jgi:DNA adenine methylase
MQTIDENEPLVLRSAPGARIVDGRVQWLKQGTLVDGTLVYEDAPGGAQAIGVPKQMPEVGATGSKSMNNKGVQSHRYSKGYNMTAPLKAPYPWPGGKSDAAPLIWARLGDCPNYVEPFAGSAAALLARPHDLSGKTETVNDVDGFVINALRAITYAPDETAHWCDWPVSECDLTSIHLWLKAQRPDLTARLFADPEYCDPKVAGRWLWGIASWIGDGWCVADGPWIAQDGLLVDRRTIGSEAEGVCKKMPTPDHERGFQQLRADGVPRKMPEIGKSPNGQIGFNRKGVQAYRYHEGVPKQMPKVGANGAGADSSRSGVLRIGYDTPGALLDYFARLSDRLRRVRFLCGDWQRAVKDSVTVNHGLTSIVLDPPYPAAEHDMAYHAEHGGDVWYEAAQWAVDHGDDHRLRICIAGYDSPATDALFPASWARERWQARGGYANQKADGRGRANAKRECLWFSPNCLNPLEQAKDALSRPMVVRESDFAGTLFEELV